MITKDDALRKIRALKEELQDLIDHHEVMKHDDPYYESPDTWWAEVMIMDLDTARRNQTTD